MSKLFNRMAVIGLAIFGQSAVQAHNADDPLPSVIHFVTAPDHLGFIVLSVALLCAVGLRLQKTVKTIVTKK